MKNFLLGIFVSFLVIAIVGVSYFLGLEEGKQQKTQLPIASITTFPTPTQSPTAVPTLLPKDTKEIRNTLLKIITEKSYNDLSPLLTDTVIVTLYASECCGPLSKTKTISQMSYLDTAEKPWNFDEKNPIILSLQRKDPKNFENTIIGISKDRYGVAFKLNLDDKIEKIVLLPDYQLITE